MSTPRWMSSPRCGPFMPVCEHAVERADGSWERIEDAFLRAMEEFDSSVAATAGTDLDDEAKSELTADLQNGKGDFFNDLLAVLLRNCAGIDALATRSRVPGLIVPVHNLDGAYPSEGPIRFLLEAKMFGTPKHANNPRQNQIGRPGSADIDKRVKELAFKSIDLKGEYSRRRTAEGAGQRTGGAGGGDITTWLRGIEPKIYFFIGVRVVSDSDFERALRWATTAEQVVDAVGMFCFEPVGDEQFTTYRRRTDIPPSLQIERVLYKACTDLQALAGASPPPVGPPPGDA